jgi:hypothetical protein
MGNLSIRRRQALRLLLVCLVRGSGLGPGPSLIHAQGGPPLQTDDPGTPGHRHWEVNVAATLEHTADGTLYEAPLGDANYGVGERIQLKLEVPLLVERRAGTRTGVGNPVIGVKWRFLDDSSSQLTISTYPQFEFSSPIAPLEDIDESRSALLLPVELARVWGRFGINTEAGYRIVHRGSDEVIYGLALGYDATRRLALLSECNGSSARLRSGELVCQLGARQEVAEHLSLLGAVGRGVVGDRDDCPRFQMYLGLQSRW